MLGIAVMASVKLELTRHRHLLGCFRMHGGPAGPLLPQAPRPSSTQLQQLPARRSVEHTKAVIGLWHTLNTQERLLVALWFHVLDDYLFFPRSGQQKKGGHCQW